MKISELNRMSDIDFAVWLLQRKLDAMYSPETPMARKLRSAIATLRQLSKGGTSRDPG